MNLTKILKYGRVYYNWRVKKSVKLNYLPDDISIETTNICNFKCQFCPQSDSEHFSHLNKSYLTSENLEIILKKLRAEGITTNLLHWTLDGEPFINKNFPELFEVALKYGFHRFHFSTNGTLCDAKTLRAFPVSHRLSITLAIDFCADPEYFESVRGTKDSWERVVNNIKSLLDAEDLNHVHIELQDIFSFSNSASEELDASFLKLKELFGERERLSMFTKTFHNAAGYLESANENSNQHIKRYFGCPYPWSSMVIASNGDVVACCRDLRHQTVLGNLLKENLWDIWNGPAARELRENLSNEKPENSEACRGCDLPYDQNKHGWANLIKTAKKRLQIFS